MCLERSDDKTLAGLKSNLVPRRIEVLVLYKYKYTQYYACQSSWSVCHRTSATNAVEKTDGRRQIGHCIRAKRCRWVGGLCLFVVLTSLP
jgi:hypothetical protein